MSVPNLKIANQPKWFKVKAKDLRELSAKDQDSMQQDNITY